MQPIVLSSTVGRSLVHYAQEANPITVDDNNQAVVDLPGPVRRAIVEARVLTIASFLVLLALMAVPYALFKRAVSRTRAHRRIRHPLMLLIPVVRISQGRKKLGLLLQIFNQQPTGPSRDPASRLVWQLSTPNRPVPTSTGSAD